nr:hypothetical protein [Tanacetum cinerariifolium]
MLQGILTASYGDPLASAFSHCLERDVEVRNNKIEYIVNELEQVKKEKEGLDNKLTGFETASKDLDNLLGSQRSDKNKEGLGYNADPPPPTQVYSPPKKDFNVSISDLGESSGSIMSKPMIKFVKAADCPRVIKTNKTKNARKSPVKYAEMYRNTSKSPKVRARPKAVINAVKTNGVNDVKASACWVWKPIKPNSASITLKRYDYVDVRGRSRSVMAWVSKKACHNEKNYVFAPLTSYCDSPTGGVSVSNNERNFVERSTPKVMRNLTFDDQEE